MKRLAFHICYWLLSILLLSLILLCVGYTFGQSLLTSCALLPGVLLAKYLGRSIPKSPCQKAIAQWSYLSLIILFTTYLVIFCIHWYLMEVSPDAILINPLLILLIIACYTILNIFLEQKILSGIKTPPEKHIEFISNRKKVRLDLDTISYIESNDDIVTVHTTIGPTYRTKMNISRWAEVLDTRFIRIHRSYIVNKSLITDIHPDTLLLGSTELPISRKYRERM